MALHRLTTPYGAPAFRALREAIDQVQAGDPLARGHGAGALQRGRRRRSPVAGRHGGIAAAQFLTAFRFAELLGGQALAESGRRPVSTPVVDVAVRQVLAASSGIFEPIAHHQATITALRNTYRDLRHLPPAAAPAPRRPWLRARPRGRPAAAATCTAALAGRVVRRSRSAARRVRRSRAGARAAPSCSCRSALRATEQALLDALAEHGEVVVIEGTAQLPSRRRRSRSSMRPMPTRKRARRCAPSSQRCTTARRCTASASSGRATSRTPGWSASTFTRPASRGTVAPASRCTSASPPGWCSIVLRLDRRGIRRADLFALLAHVPARTADGSARSPPVVGAAVARRRPRRRRRLERAAHRLQRPHRPRGGERDVPTPTRRCICRPSSPTCACSWARPTHDCRGSTGPTSGHRFLHRWLGGHRGIAALPPDEFEAFTAVQASLDRLGRLDALAQPVTARSSPTRWNPNSTARPGASGASASACTSGPLSFAVGQPFELLVVVGACEGLLPAPPPPGGAARRQRPCAHRRRAARQRRPRRRTATPAVGGARRHRTRRAADATRRPAGHRAAPAVAVGRRARPRRRRTHARSVPSFAAGLADAAFPATLSQHRIRALTHASPRRRSRRRSTR